MVVLTIAMQKNSETIYFEDLIPRVHFMKLISCSLFNSWDTLKKEGSATLGDKDKDRALSVSKLLPGHYSLERLAKEIDGLFAKYQYKVLQTAINQPVGQLVIRNFGAGEKPIELDRDLANLLGIGRKLLPITFVKWLTSPTTYFIHCDLIDTERNLFNSKRSDVLALFDVKGKPFEKVSYQGSPQQVLRDCSTDEFINSITISVKDENGELFDFKGFPLLFELVKLNFFIYAMSSANLLPPSAPPAENERRIYPSLPETTNAENFRLTEISKIEKEISAKVKHYRLVLKKYKKARKAIHYSVVGLGAITAALSSGAVATSLTGVGIVIGPPVAAIAALSGAVSTGLSVVNKKLERKVNKHSRIHSLAVAKHDSINSSVSQALNDNCVSDMEFQLITREMQKYSQLKETLRSNFAQKQTNPLQPDIEKIRNQTQQEFIKQLAESSTNLN